MQALRESHELLPKPHLKRSEKTREPTRLRTHFNLIRDKHILVVHAGLDENEQHYVETLAIKHHVMHVG